MFTPALVISIFALIFTVFCFWWMNWRKGALHVGTPRTYAAFSSGQGKMVLEFPFVFFNDGPMPIVVSNLRVIIRSEEHPHPLAFVATVKKLAKDEDRAFATQFPVRGREALLLICEFQRQQSGMVFESFTYDMELQAKIGTNKKWKRLSRFPLNVSEQSASIISKQFVAHDNILDEN